MGVPGPVKHARLRSHTLQQFAVVLHASEIDHLARTFDPRRLARAIDRQTDREREREKGGGLGQEQGHTERAAEGATVRVGRLGGCRSVRLCYAPCASRAARGVRGWACLVPRAVYNAVRALAEHVVGRARMHILAKDGTPL
jgi:hypothetical protein